MSKPLLCLLFVSILPVCLSAQTTNPDIESEVNKIDALTADPDIKLVVVAAMSDHLKVHRNHLILLRKQTGQSYGSIFASALRERGMDDVAILRQLRMTNREIGRRLARFRLPSGDTTRPRPVLFVSTSADNNSAGTFYSLVPEIGIDSSRASLVVGIPYYRTFATNVTSGGVGDVYVTGFLKGRAAGFDLATGINIAAPTGDPSKGLGAGKVTADATGMIARRYEFARPWVSAGFTNSVFNNVGYQRSYITDGNAAHFSGGLDLSAGRRLTLGFAGFALRPTGAQTVHSRTMGTNMANDGGPVPAVPNPGGMMPGGHTTPGVTGSSTSGSTSMPLAMPFYNQAQETVLSADELQDYGASAWVSIRLRQGLSLNVTAARSLPFHLTTVRIGMGFDLARLLFPGKHF
ncbi:MAG: hypothetical protein LC130_26685 [Bryobacterales bacterium]|nr:hypothetical protein [Bryobacterales bacterium]